MPGPTMTIGVLGSFGRRNVEVRMNTGSSEDEATAPLSHVEATPRCRRPVGDGSSTTAQLTCTASGCSAGEEEML